MSMIKKTINSSLFSFFFSGLIKVSQLFKVSFIVGSYTAFFSAANCMVPLSGAFAGLPATGLVTVCLMIVRVLFSTWNPFILLVYHVPGFFASAYLASKSFFIRLVVPIVCMFLFVIHPVGGSAWVYSLYWLIPAVLYFYKNESFFLAALGSTFVAHAVGSVIWIYAVPMTAHDWLHLMPVVCIERIVFALGMTGIYHAVNAGIKALHAFRSKIPVKGVSSLENCGR